MGRVFLKHIGGQRLYVCAGCETPLTNRNQLLSTRFTGATGRAFLFNNVVNLTYRLVMLSTASYGTHKVWLSIHSNSEVQDRVMLTGRHMVRDVSCKNCDTKLGWIYEFATEDNQRYKEGKVILERALVNEVDGFAENVSND